MLGNNGLVNNTLGKTTQIKNILGKRFRDKSIGGKSFPGQKWPTQPCPEVVVLPNWQPRPTVPPVPEIPRASQSSHASHVSQASQSSHASHSLDQEIKQSCAESQEDARVRRSCDGLEVFGTLIPNVPHVTKATGNDTVCCTCEENVANAAFVPCGHVCVCLQCVHDMYNRRFPEKIECPVCTNDIDSIIRIFVQGAPTHSSSVPTV